MKTEKGVIVVAWKKPSIKPRYIVLKRKKNWEGWELPKGHLENGYESTVELELEEEAGIREEQIQELEPLNHTVEWEFERDNEEIKREYRGFLVKVDDDATVDTGNNPSDEHEFGYFFNYEDTHSMLTYEDQKELLEKAREELKERKV
ncbi:MAG: NUDIX domain-containing protein [Candidatus Nanohaloarchaea archaeon]